MILYREIVVGASAYSASGPSMSTLPASPTGGVLAANVYVPAPGWEPHFHKYTNIGPSGADVMFSYDGVNDHGRILGVAGALGPTFDVAYKKVWLRIPAGVTSTIGVGFYTRQ